jgi:plasmid stabilization system protein ParE
MKRILWLPDAIRDIQRLHDFMSGHSIDAANRLLNELHRASGSLIEFPELGRPYLSAADFRELVVPFGRRSYVVRYRITGEDIVIARVWHPLEDRR